MALYVGGDAAILSAAPDSGREKERACLFPMGSFAIGGSGPARYLTHTFPAVMIDSHKALTGKPASTLREARRLREALEAFSFFTTHEWVFDTATLAEVHARLPAADKTLCNCDVQGFSWDVYMTVWAHGMKVFLLDEGPVLCARPRSQPMQRSRL